MNDAPDRTEEPQSLLLQISNAMVRAQKEYFGKGPEKAKSYMLDDFLLIVMRGGVTVAERTMLDADRENLVREFRQEFENEMTSKLVSMIEDLTGRKVLTYQSQILFEPDIVLEIFFFDERADVEQIEATAREQLDAEASTEASAEVAEDIPPDVER